MARMRMAYQVQGPKEGAPVLVLLHAFPLSSAIFAPLVKELGGAVRTIAVDLPGLGGSEAAGAPSVRAMAGAVLGVLRREKVERAVVLGISTGGYVALELAAMRPHLLTALVLASTTSRVIAPDVPEERLALAARLDGARTTRLVMDTADDGLGETAKREQPALRRRLRKIIAAGDPAGVAWVCRALAARRDTSDVVAGLEVPVLLLFGAEDPGTPPERAAELLALRAGLAPGLTRREILPDTGHLTVLERPAEVAALLIEFVGGL